MNLTTAPRLLLIAATALWPALAAGTAAAQEPETSLSAGPEAVETVMTGRIVDVVGIAVEGVTVKLFEDSYFVAETATDVDGDYTLTFTHAPASDNSIVVWYLPREADLVPEMAVLRESFKSKELKLLSPCLPRVTLETTVTHDVELLDEKSKLSSLSKSECFKGAKKS
jgi:hypothetical protein